jgi:1,6-anhydro-N-acetylmuramate kinase
MRAIGLMSGTSLDGIDEAMIETDRPITFPSTTGVPRQMTGGFIAKHLAR